MSDNTGRYSGRATGGNPFGPGVQNGRCAAWLGRRPAAASQS
jgi:hypothetical protein